VLVLDIWTLLGVSIALAVDAFAVALAAGAVLNPLAERRWFRLSFHFGLFQALMPIAGWLAGRSMQHWISRYDHWVAFGLLGLIGGRMIFEALKAEEDKIFVRDPTKGLTMVMLSVATSIDALAVGFSLAILQINIWFPALIIGVVAAILTFIGMLLGKKIGSLWGQRVEIAGGIVLCLIGLKILVDHLSR
jgi:putative Mn2+ efflux pump MntP